MTKINSKCKLCRRAGEKLFLKGERCNSPKCALVRKNYTPGFQGKNSRPRRLSYYGKQLKEKQKLRHWYLLKEGQFKKYVRKALRQRKSGGNSQEILITSLERRLDNVVFRLGFAPSRNMARQLVSHGHFAVNGRKVNISSFAVKKGDKISLKEASQKKPVFAQIEMELKKHEVPSWLKLDVKKLTGEVVGEPSVEEVMPPAQIASIFEYYSR